MIEKKTSKNNAVKVTFQLPEAIAEKSVAVVGDFNAWDETKGEMKRGRKNGYWRKTLTFEAGQDLQFRYLIDGRQWRNDEQADRYVANGFGTENGVLIL